MTDEQRIAMLQRLIEHDQNSNSRYKEERIALFTQMIADIRARKTKKLLVKYCDDKVLSNE